jgi:hypothetical protein
LVLPVRQRPEEVLLAVIVKVYWPPGSDVLEVENDVGVPDARCKNFRISFRVAQVIATSSPPTRTVKWAFRNASPVTFAA